MVSNNPLISGRNSWDVACLKDISIKIGSGSTPRGGESAYIPERINFAFIRSQNIYDFKFDVNGLKFISDEDANKLKGVHLQKDDVLLNITGDGVTFSRCCLVPDDILPAAVNQHVAIIRLDTTKCLPGYLMAYLCLPETKAYIESFNAGGSRRAITKGHIESFEIPLPPMHIQGEISKIALSLLAKQDINTQINQTLEQMAQALFKSWFVDFDPVVDNALDAGFFEQNLDLPDELLRRAEARQAVRKQSDFKPLPDATRQLFPAAFEACAEPSLGLAGWVPKGWGTCRTSDFGSIVCGKTPSKKIDEFYGYDIPFIKIPDMHGNVFLTKTEDGLSSAGSNSQIKKLLPENSVCVSCIATIGIVSITTKPAHTNQQINSIIPNKYYFRDYLYFSLLDKKKIFNDLASGGSATLNMNTGVFSKVIFLLPEEHVLVEFHSQSGVFLERIKQSMKEVDVLSNLRDTLLPKLISGELLLDDIGADLTTE